MLNGFFLFKAYTFGDYTVSTKAYCNDERLKRRKWKKLIFDYRCENQ